MQRFTLVLAFFLMSAGLWLRVSIGAQNTEAQEPLTLESLETSLWPEYDQPEVLVIYRGLFAADTSLPVPVEISIPARVGQPSAVAYVSDGGDRLNQQYTTRVEGDWLVVSFELDALGFQLEYYDTLPVDSAGKRQFTYSYIADYPITTLSLDVQVPPTAEGFTLDPPADSVITESDSLVYHLINAGSLAQGEGRNWTFTYQKDNVDLTASTLSQSETAATPASQAASQEAGGANNSTVLIFLVAFVALVAVGAAAFWLGRRVQPISQAAPPAPQRNRRRGSGLGARADALFCAQCGAELRSDAVFCHRCGTPTRKG